MTYMLKKVSIAAALALTLSVSAHASVTNGGLVETSTVIPGSVVKGSFSDLINFTVAPNAGAGVLASALTYKTNGAKLESIFLYKGTFSSLAQLNAAKMGGTAVEVFNSHAVTTSVDGFSTSTKIVADAGVLDYKQSYTLLVNGVGKGNGGAYSAQITLDTLPAVPEPETYAMLLAGLGLMGAVARRKSKNVKSVDAVTA